MTLTEEQREAIRVISKLPMAIGCQLCHPYIMKNYGSHFIVLRNMIDSSGTVEPTGGFDLEKARACAVFVEPKEAFLEALDEIERLRAELDNYGDDFVCQTKCKDARIKELESSLDEAEALIKKNAELMNSCLTRIAELEDALVGERAQRYSLENAGTQLSQVGYQFQKRCRQSACQQLQAEGKIGPDAKPRSWQITEERKTMLSHCLEVVDYVATTKAYSDAIRDRDTIRAMLEENL